MSEDDIRRIADAIEKMVEAGNKDSTWEVVAEIHENYGIQLKAILDSERNAFEVAVMLRQLQDRAFSTASQIRTTMV